MFWARSWQGRWERDAAAERFQARRQPLVAGDGDNVFADVAAVRREPLHRRIVRQDQRPFELEHERAARDQGDDVVAPVDPFAERGRGVPRAVSDPLDIALLELRHAAAAGVDDGGLDTVSCQHRAGCGADLRLVVVAEAGRIDHRLAPEGGCLTVDRRRCRAGTVEHGAAVVARQRRLPMDAGDGLQQRPGEPVAPGRAPVHDRRKSAREPAVAVGLRKLPGRAGVAPARAAVGSPVAQHEMGKIDVPLVRRRVGAHGHEAHVAERAGIRDRLEAGGVHGIELARLRLIDQVEQPRERITEIEAASAAVADVEDPPGLPLERLGVVELGVSPVYGMAEGRALVGHRVGEIIGTSRRAGCLALRCRIGVRNADNGAGSPAPPGDPAPQARRRARSSPVHGPHSGRLRAAHPILSVFEARASLCASSLTILQVGIRRRIVADHGP